jgi:hypothetical protein
MLIESVHMIDYLKFLTEIWINQILLINSCKSLSLSSVVTIRCM